MLLPPPARFTSDETEEGTVVELEKSSINYGSDQPQRSKRVSGAVVVHDEQQHNRSSTSSDGTCVGVGGSLRWNRNACHNVFQEKENKARHTHTITPVQSHTFSAELRPTRPDQVIMSTVLRHQAYLAHLSAAPHRPNQPSGNVKKKCSTMHH